MFFAKLLVALFAVANLALSAHGIYTGEWWGPFGVFLAVASVFAGFSLYTAAPPPLGALATDSSDVNSPVRRAS